MTRSQSEWSSLDEVSAEVERLAVLLAAGITPNAAWGYLAEPEPAGQHPAKRPAKHPAKQGVAGHGSAGQTSAAHIVRAVSRVDAGHPIGEAILEAIDATSFVRSSSARTTTRSARSGQASEESAWRGLAAAWIVATESGAPLSQTLIDFATSLRALAQARRDASVALSGPTATAKLVLLMPAVGILFGMALGFNTLGTLVTTIPGLACLLAGGSLLVAGRAWNKRLVARSTPTDLTPGLLLDLFAIAVSGGASIDRADRAVSRAADRCGIGGGQPLAGPVLELARRAGVPAGALLRSEADRVRRDAKSNADRMAAKLAVTLMMPLGLCVLPAFMLLGVAPLMIAVLSSTVAVF